MAILVAIAAMASAAVGQLKVTAPDGPSGFPNHLGVHDGVVIAGAPAADEVGQDSGAAYLIDATSGLVLHKLLPDDGAPGDRFGHSVAIHSQYAVVGAPRDDDQGGDSGSAYVFDVSSGQQMVKLLPTGGQGGDEFASSGGVAVQGSTVIVGAPRANNGRGIVYVFDAATGAQAFALEASDGSPGQWFGNTVAVSGSRLLVGSPAWPAGTAGSAYVFDLATGAELLKIGDPEPGAGDLFGIRVGLSGTVSLIGKNRDDSAGTNSGAAFLFDIVSGDQLAKLVAPDASSGDEGGEFLSIGSDLAVVGVRHDDDQGFDSGSASVYRVPTGDFLGKLVPADTNPGDRFGAPVAVEGKLVAIGSVGADDAGVDSGAFYVFDFAGPWVTLGGGSRGTASTPRLTGEGTIQPGSTAELTLTGAPLMAPFVAWVSLAPSAFPALNGLVQAYPYAAQIAGFTDGNGGVVASATWPSGLPVGTMAWFQFVVVDASSPFGLRLSNGLMAVTP